MDYKLLIIGAVPPFLAILAEICNPVSGEALRPGIEEIAWGLAFSPQKGQTVEIGNEKKLINSQDDVTRERERRAGLIADAMTRMATAGVEVSGVIPTWIGATSGIVAICAERVDPLPLAIVTAIWIGVSAMMGMRYFLRLNYWDFGLLTHLKLPFKKEELIRQERLSLILIGTNCVVILVAVLVAYFIPPPSEGLHS